MESRMEEFKEFVKAHPKLKFDVRDKRRTWQEIYEEWAIMGDDESFNKYKEDKTVGFNSVEGQETLRQIVNFAKNINPNTITKTLNTAQKVISLFQGFNNLKGNNAPTQPQNSFSRDPLFGKFNDWD